MMETNDVQEKIPGGFHTVRRVFLKNPGARKAVCPNCHNADQDKFQTVVEGTVLKGLLCMACTLPR
jgi:hypothetical protein